MLENVDHRQIARRGNAVREFDISLCESRTGITQLLGDHTGLAIEESKGRTGKGKPQDKSQNCEPNFSRSHHRLHFS
jgi:hypothetical protein